MTQLSSTPDIAVAQGIAASQHGPRPLPLFLSIIARETADDPATRQRAMAGLRRYQAAPRREAEARKIAVKGRVGRARLLSYGGTGTPVLFVPSLINPPLILDLAPERSLLGWLAEQGFAAHMIDWGTPEPDAAMLDVAGHVAHLLRGIIALFDEPPVLVGYCLGGTMAMAAACLSPVRALGLIATPWDFSVFSQERREALAQQWTSAEPACSLLGLVPMEVLQAGFWSLDPARIVRKFADFADYREGSADEAMFIALEDWANGGAPLTLAAGRELFLDFFGGNRPGEGRWQVEGHSIDPTRLICPVWNLGSTTDRIVPIASAPLIGERHSTPAGHVGMVVSRHARTSLWEPLAGWLAKVT